MFELRAESTQEFDKYQVGELSKFYMVLRSKKSVTSISEKYGVTIGSRTVKIQFTRNKRRD